jgi:hypothetical protein
MNWQELAKPPKRFTGTMVVASVYMYKAETPEEIHECFRLLDIEDKSYFVGLPLNPLDRRIIK